MACSAIQVGGPSTVQLMSGEGIKRENLHRSAQGINDLQAPSPPLVGACGRLRTKLLDRFYGGDHGRPDAGSLNALFITDHVIAVREVEVVARWSGRGRFGPYPGTSRWYTDAQTLSGCKLVFDYGCHVWGRLTGLPGVRRFRVPPNRCRSGVRG